MIAIVSAAIVRATEQCSGGRGLPGVTTKHFRISCGDTPRGDFDWTYEGSYSVEVGASEGRYDRTRGDLLILRATDEEPTHEVVVRVEDRGDRFVTVVEIGDFRREYRTISMDIDPRRQLWWSWKNWFSRMVDASRVRAEEDAFLADCYGGALSVTARNRLAYRVLYRLARESGWRMLGTKFAAKLGLRAGAWITDEEFHAAGAAAYPDWMRTGASEASHRDASGTMPDA